MPGKKRKKQPKNKQKEKGMRALTNMPSSNAKNDEASQTSETDTRGKIRQLMWAGYIQHRVGDLHDSEDHLYNAINMINEYQENDRFNNNEKSEFWILKCRAYLMNAIGATSLDDEEEFFGDSGPIAYASTALIEATKALKEASTTADLFSSRQVIELQNIDSDIKRCFLDAVQDAVDAPNFEPIYRLINSLYVYMENSNKPCSKFLRNAVEKIENVIKPDAKDLNENYLRLITKINNSLEIICKKHLGSQNDNSSKEENSKGKEKEEQGNIEDSDKKALEIILSYAKNLIDVIQYKNCDIMLEDSKRLFQQYKDFINGGKKVNNVKEDLELIDSYCDSAVSLNNFFITEYKVISDKYQWIKEVGLETGFILYLSETMKKIQVINDEMNKLCEDSCAVVKSAFFAKELIVEEGMLRHNHQNNSLVKGKAKGSKKAQKKGNHKQKKSLVEKKGSGSSPLTWAADNMEVAPRTAFEYQLRGEELYSKQRLDAAKENFEKANEYASKDLVAPKDLSSIEAILSVWMKSGKDYTNCLKDIANEKLLKGENIKARESWVEARDYLVSMHEFLCTKQVGDFSFNAEAQKHELEGKIIDLSFRLLPGRPVQEALDELERMKLIAIHGFNDINLSQPGHQRHPNWLVKIYIQEAGLLRVVGCHLFNRHKHNIHESIQKFQEALSVCGKALQLIPPHETELLTYTVEWIQNDLLSGVSKVKNEIKRRIGEVVKLEQLRKTPAWTQNSSKKGPAPKTIESYIYADQLNELMLGAKVFEKIDKDASSYVNESSDRGNVRREAVRCKLKV